MRSTMSDARRASATRRFVSSRIFSMSGSGRSNQRKLVSPFVNIVARGWFTSCVIEAANTPRLVTLLSKDLISGPSKVFGAGYVSVAFADPCLRRDKLSVNGDCALGAYAPSATSWTGL
jgi:hypothetical protein